MAPVTPTTLPDNSKIKTNGTGVITGGIKKSTYIALVNERDALTAELGTAQKQVCEGNQTNLGLTKQIENLTKMHQESLKEIEDKNNQISEITKTVTERDTEIANLTKLTNSQAEDIVKLQSSLDDAVKSLKDGGKFAKSEQSKDTRKKIWDNIKDRHYRTIKFVRGQELTDLTRQVYADIKDSIKDDSGNPVMDSEFVRIYESYVQEALGARRQYTQTQLQDAFVGKSLMHVRLTKLRVILTKLLPPALQRGIKFTTPCHRPPISRIHTKFRMLPILMPSNDSTFSCGTGVLSFRRLQELNFTPRIW